MFSRTICARNSVFAFPISFCRSGRIQIISKWYVPSASYLSTYSRGGKSPYEVLNVSTSASLKEIKLAYYKLAKEFHPDLHNNKPASEQDKMKKKFQEISAAYELLSDESNRKQYDNGVNSGADWRTGQQQQAYQDVRQDQHYVDMFEKVLQDSEVST